MYQIAIDASGLEWTPLDFAGVSMRVLRRDDETGAMTVMTRMDAGAAIPAHWHTNADETVFVIDGDFVENGASHGPAAFFAARRGTAHGPHSTVNGCTLLTTFSAELDFQLIAAGDAPIA